MLYIFTLKGNGVHVLGAFHKYILILLICFSFSFAHEGSITLTQLSELDLTNQLVPESFILESVHYVSDVFFQEDEFNYLVGLQSGETVTQEILKKALYYLFNKNKFSSITVKRTDNKLDFIFSSFWTVKGIKVHGIWFGSDEYKTLYLTELGERFDKEKHIHSIKRIKEICRNEGYAKPTIKSSLEYDYKTKAVIVHLTIDKGKKFTIGSVASFIHFDEIAFDEINILKAEINKKFIKKLTKKSYQKSLLEHYAQRIKRYLIEKGYFHCSIALHEQFERENTKVNLTWDIELQQKRAFIFSGNIFFSGAQLLEHIMQFGRSATLLPATLLAEEIERLYKEYGFMHAKIETQEEKNRYFFTIKENQRATIASIKIHGLKHYSAKYVIKKCITSLRHSFVVKKNIENALERITAWYAKKGFLDIQIVNHTFELTNKEKQQYTLHITLEEGLRCFISKVEMPNFVELISQGPFYFGKHVPFSASEVQKQQQWLTDYFRKKGFLRPKVKPEFDKKDQAISITWLLEPGVKTVVGKTVLTGSSRISFATIKREACYQEGDAWDRDALRKTFKRLKDTQTFEAIQLIPSSDPWGNNERPILISIQKDEPFELRLRAGLELEQIRQWQSFTGVSYRVGGSFIVKSPFDIADQLRFDGDFASKHREIIARYQTPWIGYIPVKTIVQAYSIKHDQGFLGIKKDVYNVHQNGFLVGIHKKIPHLDSGINVGFEWMETSINRSEAQTRALAIQISDALNFEPSLLNRQVPFIFVEPSLFVDFLDNKLFPTKGWFSLITLKGMFPVKRKLFDSYFVRLLIEQKVFMPIQSLITVLRIRYGHIFHQDFRAIMPNERFYLGGVNSLRSYDTDLAPPLGSFVDSDCKEQVVPQGGKSMVNANIEFRVSLFNNIGVALFQDFGFLSSNNFADFEVEKVLAGSGFGIWYNTPLGPIRLDVGWKWSTIEPFERPYAWFLTLGQSF